MTRTEHVEALLLELAAAGEDIIMAEGSARYRAALDAAWEYLDPDYSIRHELRRAAGCVECGKPVIEIDGVPMDLCKEHGGEE